MNFEELSNLRIIVVVGPPGAGKTTLCKAIVDKFPRFTIVHTDDYIKYGFVEAAYKLLQDIKDKDNIIVEGVQSARVLRKGLELRCFIPDGIINFQIEDQELFNRYAAREGGKKYPLQMKNAIVTIFNDYLLSLNSLIPNRVKIISIQ